MKTFRLLALLGVTLIALIAIGAVQATGITLERYDATYRFTESITFTLSASSDVSITQATVFYQAGSALPVRHTADSLIPAPRIDLTTTVSFGNAKPAAFSTLTYWWEITDQSGKTLRSDPHTLAYIDNRFAWMDLTQGKVRVHWYQGDSGFGQSAAMIANEALPKLQQQLGVEATGPIDVYIYQSVEDLQSAVELAGRSWLGGQARPELGVVMIATPPDAEANLRLRRDLPHELTHLMVFIAAKTGYRSVPRWLDEGLASVNEAEPNASQRVALQTALEQNQVPSLESLCASFPTDASSALVAYAESRVVVQQIIDSYGLTSIQALMAVYRDGASCATGIERALNTTLSGLEFKWRASLGPSGGVAAVAQNSGPWLLIWIAIAIPFFALLLLRKPKQN
ncbi:MAG: peptidase MA family metallohydrolase [Anaerolineae bacterium]